MELALGTLKENKLSTLMARLEKIEKIALGESKSKDLAVYPLK